LIDILFQFGPETILVKIDGSDVKFSNTTYGAIWTTIEGLQLNRKGVQKEFPDLKDKENWKQEAIKRFKEKIKKLNTEMDRANYVIEDLKLHGYIPRKLQVAGMRVVDLTPSYIG